MCEVNRAKYIEVTDKLDYRVGKRLLLLCTVYTHEYREAG
jgi:hypothetical protein